MTIEVFRQLSGETALSELADDMKNAIWEAVHTAPAVEVRVFGTPENLRHRGVSGIDALLTTPQILAEFFRRRSFGRADPDRHGGISVSSLSRAELADLVWRQLFVDNSPASEPARIVLTTMGMFGLDVASGDLRRLREQYAAIPDDEKVEKTTALANLDLVLFPVESLEVDEYLKEPAAAPAHRPVLALNTLLGDWRESARKLRQQGYGLKSRVDGFAPLELRRHLLGEMERLEPTAVALDWPVGRRRPDDGGMDRLLREAVLPLCRERNLAFLLAAPASGIDCLSWLWEEFPDVRFLLHPAAEEQFLPATLAAYDNGNLLLCGPDQPLSYPRALESCLGLRLETLGGMFHACHSGAVAAEEMVGCWAHMRWTLGKTLIRHYAELWRTGWRYSAEGVRQDVAALLGGNAKTFLGL